MASTAETEETSSSFGFSGAEAGWSLPSSVKFTPDVELALFRRLE